MTNRETASPINKQSVFNLDSLKCFDSVIFFKYKRDAYVETYKKGEY